MARARALLQCPSQARVRRQATMESGGTVAVGAVAKGRVRIRVRVAVRVTVRVTAVDTVRLQGES